MLNLSMTSRTGCFCLLVLTIEGHIFSNFPLWHGGRIIFKAFLLEDSSEHVGLYFDVHEIDFHILIVLLVAEGFGDRLDGYELVSAFLGGVGIGFSLWTASDYNKISNGCTTKKTLRIDVASESCRPSPGVWMGEVQISVKAI